MTLLLYNSYLRDMTSPRGRALVALHQTFLVQCQDRNITSVGQPRFIQRAKHVRARLLPKISGFSRVTYPDT